MFIIVFIIYLSDYTISCIKMQVPHTILFFPVAPLLPDRQIFSLPPFSVPPVGEITAAKAYLSFALTAKASAELIWRSAEAFKSTHNASEVVITCEISFVDAF